MSTMVKTFEEFCRDNYEDVDEGFGKKLAIGALIAGGILAGSGKVQAQSFGSHPTEVSKVQHLGTIRQDPKNSINIEDITKKKIGNAANAGVGVGAVGNLVSGNISGVIGNLGSMVAISIMTRGSSDGGDIEYFVEYKESQMDTLYRIKLPLYDGKHNFIINLGKDQKTAIHTVKEIKKLWQSAVDEHKTYTFDFTDAADVEWKFRFNEGDDTHSRYSMLQVFSPKIDSEEVFGQIDNIKRVDDILNAIEHQEPKFGNGKESFEEWLDHNKHIAMPEQGTKEYNSFKKEYNRYVNSFKNQDEENGSYD